MIETKTKCFFGFWGFLFLLGAVYFCACDLQILPGEGDRVVFREDTEKRDKETVEIEILEPDTEEKKDAGEDLNDVEKEQINNPEVEIETETPEKRDETSVDKEDTEPNQDTEENQENQRPSEEVEEKQIENEADSKADVETEENIEEEIKSSGEATESENEPEKDVQEDAPVEEKKEENNQSAEEEKKEIEKVEEPDDSANLEKTDEQGKSENLLEPPPMIDEPFIEEQEVTERQWSILVYMAADNNLEASAIEDFAEMELSEMNTDSVSVFVLLDRSAAYDITNDNWVGTRLYRLRTGKQISSKFIISEELDCKDLGLMKGVETELDMSSGYVLSDALGYIQKRYPANNYGLIMWGHGTGWRSDNGSVLDKDSENFDCASYGVRGFAFDEDAKTYMTLKQLGEALKTGMRGNKLDFLGFDTCFGMELELLYELKDCARYVVGSEGLLMASGWNYTDFFNAIHNDTEKSPESVAIKLGECFSRWYGNTNGANFAVADMNSVSLYFLCFNQIMKTVAEKITSREIRDSVMGLLYSDADCKTERFSYGAKNSDVYLDIHSSIYQLADYFSRYRVDIGLDSFKKVEDKVLKYRWSSNEKAGGIGVYFQTISTGTLLAAMHPAAYIRGKTISQISFVEDCKGYVPNVKGENSLLEKLFYERF